MSWYPLQGYRVVDFGSAWAGPQMAHIVADMGAEVIKVESRNRIDYGMLGGAASAKDLLTKTPEAIAASTPERLELNPVFHLLNRGKMGITVDFTNGTTDRATRTRRWHRSSSLTMPCSPT